MPDPSRRPTWPALVVLGWVAAAALATALTLGAVSLIEVGLFGGSTAALSEDEVAAALAAGPTETPIATPSPPSTGTASPTATAAPTQPPAATVPATPPPITPTPTTPAANPSAAVAFSRSGNTVVARCAAGVAQVVSWSPAQGYRVSDGVTLHGDEAEVEFESDSNRVRIRVSCVGAQPTASIDED